MAKLPSLTLKLLFGVFFPSLLQITSTHHLSVDPGENITLPCNVSDPEVLWYRLISGEEVKLLISAKQGNVKKSFLASYNVNEHHFDITQSSSSVNLEIIGVRETDLGFYFCGGKKDTTHIQFGKPIRLNFTDDHKADNSSKPPDTQQFIVGLRITMCVCLVSVLINLIFMCVFCCRLKGKSVSSCSCCSNTTDTPEKEKDIHYAIIQQKRRSRAAAKENAASYSDSVTYATVASQPRRY